MSVTPDQLKELGFYQEGSTDVCWVYKLKGVNQSLLFVILFNMTPETKEQLFGPQSTEPWNYFYMDGDEVEYDQVVSELADWERLQDAYDTGRLA